MYVKGRLLEITNWEGLAGQSRYSCENLAGFCGVCTRQLERFFLYRFQMTPRRWMQILRMHRARALIQSGQFTKTVALELHFKGSPQFCREFKKHFGQPPQYFAPRPACRISSTMSQSAHSLLLNGSVLPSSMNSELQPNS